MKPLSDIRILDLTRLLPGPLCTLHLADMGADVIKIEDTKAGDYARAIPPLQKTMSVFFLAVNRNKRSVKIDLNQQKGKEIFLELARKADVIVESFRPGVMKKLGIDYETIKKINPKIVYCSITGYGQTGPYKDKAGHDLNYISYAGLLKDKNIPNFQIGDIVGGSLNAAMAILAAIIQQIKTGEGQYLDVSMLDGIVANSVVSLSHLSSKELLGIDTSGMLNGALHCYNIYETKEGRFMALGALEYKFWKQFCDAVEKPEWVANHILMGDESEKMFSQLEELFKTKTQDEWVSYFINTDCCISPVLNFDESIQNEQVKSRDLLKKFKHEKEGEVQQFSPPVKFSNFDFQIERHAPIHGEHSEEVLKESGFSKEEIESFRKNNII
ncbi:MAG: carnitine dehydratase [Flavobacteriales bacterium]|nr:MAG: carnitine dehydratase [Flavobacteriales bacterium]